MWVVNGRWFRPLSSIMIEVVSVSSSVVGISR